MLILLISSAYNSLTQRTHMLLQRLGHRVAVELTASLPAAQREKQLTRQYRHWQPELTLCPFLTTAIPREIYDEQRTFICHPGPLGDRGPSALDRCLLTRRRIFGTTLLLAEAEMDAGAAYSSVNYRVPQSDAARSVTKSSLYRREAADAALLGVQELLQKWQWQRHQGLHLVPHVWSAGSANGNESANGDAPLDVSVGVSVSVPEDGLAPLPALLPALTQKECAIDWARPAHEIARIVRARDTLPGVLDATLLEINGYANTPVFLYGAHEERRTTGIQLGDALHANRERRRAGTLLGQRHGAVLVLCGQNTALWITHMKLQRTKQQLACTQDAPTYKLPAARVLPAALRSALKPLDALPGSSSQWWDWHEIQLRYPVPGDGGVCCVHFDFYNGAMGTDQCRRLREVLARLRADARVRVVILMGGADCFSNGVHLNLIEAAADPAQESWDNINAIDDVCLEVLRLRADKQVISYVRGGAGAGGVFLALAAARVYADAAAVLNPHYGLMNLFGSEYWTYSLPRRVGAQRAAQMMSECLPLDAAQALAAGLLDGVVSAHEARDAEALVRRLLSKPAPVWDCALEALEPEWAAHRARELAVMRQNFADPNYHAARRNFVHKVTPPVTPWFLQRSNARAFARGARVEGRALAAQMRAALAHKVRTLHEQQGVRPRVVVLQAGARADSTLFVREKMRAGAEVGVQVQHQQLALEADAEGDWSAARLERELQRRIRELNADPTCHGIVLQLPLPVPGVDASALVREIAPQKDVDGLGAATALALREAPFRPCVVEAVLHVLRVHDVKLRALHCVVLGASEFVGLPLALELKRQHATVSCCDIHTPETERQRLLDAADVVISAAGVPGLVRSVKLGACVIDAGVMVVQPHDGGCSAAAGRVCGDVDAEAVGAQASLLAAVPGGVGPVTVAVLLEHVYKAACALSPACARTQ